MKSTGKYLIAVIAAVAFTMVMTDSSRAAFSSGSGPSLAKRMEFQRKKPPTAAHRIVTTARKNKKDSFSNLNR